jgi:MFS family permease
MRLFDSNSKNSAVELPYPLSRNYLAAMAEKDGDATQRYGVPDWRGDSAHDLQITARQTATDEQTANEQTANSPIDTAAENGKAVINAIDPTTSAAALTNGTTAQELNSLDGETGGNSGGNSSNGDSAEQPTNAGDEAAKELDAEEPERGLLPVLRNRNFLTLWGGQVFSQLADKVYLVLMIALIANRFQTEGQTISGWVSTLMIAFTIPAVLFGSIAGVFVDHWHKRAVLVSTNLLRGGLVLGLPFLLWLTQSWSPLGPWPVGFLIVLGITFLVSTLTQFFAPAEQAVIPLIVERRHLLSANSLYTMTMMASVIVGFALGEPLLALADQFFDPLMRQLHAGPDMGKELVVGGSYVIAGLMLMVLRTYEKTVHSHEELPDVWSNIQDGVRYLSQQGRVRAALIAQVILFSIFAALAVLAVRLAEVMPELKSSQFGFLLAAGGVGMAIGAILVGQFGQRFSRAQLSLYGSTGIAASLAAISFFTHHLFPTLPFLVLLGACAAIAGVPMQTAIQEETPEAMRGKVFGLQNNAINIALSLPLALAGVAETWFGLQTVFLGLSVLAIGGGILTWSISRGHNQGTQSSKITP